jgi:CubicO group peptidase (beta-lactamase class C family)
MVDDALVGVLRRARVPGVQVAVAADGHVLVEAAAGRAGGGRPWDVRTPAQVGSIAKLVTALVVHRLAADGVVSLEEDLRRAVPGARPGPPATLGDALSHVAGAARHGYLGSLRRPGMPGRRGDPVADRVPDPVVVRRARRALGRGGPPGAFRYSGGGYLAVQVLLERRTGRSLTALADECVLAPAGMADSRLASDPARRSATGHASLVPVPGRSLRYRETAAAGLWSTAGDLVRLALALRSGGVLAASAPALVTPVAATGEPAPLAAAGRGVFLDHVTEPHWFCHPGRTVGYGAWLWGRLDGSVSVAAVTNGMPGSGTACWAAAGAACAVTGLAGPR